MKQISSPRGSGNLTVLHRPTDWQVKASEDRRRGRGRRKMDQPVSDLPALCPLAAPQELEAIIRAMPVGARQVDCREAVQHYARASRGALIRQAAPFRHSLELA